MDAPDQAALQRGPRNNMRGTMRTVSLTSAWDDTRAYIAREMALLTPVALGTIGLGMVILFLAAPDTPPGGQLQPGPWMLALIPYLLLLAGGALALSALALTPGMSVREALTAAARRLASAIGALMLLAVGAFFLLLVISQIAALLGRFAGIGISQSVTLGVAIALPLLAILGVRFLFAVPAIVSGFGPAAALRHSWRISDPCKWRLVALWIVVQLLSLLLVATIEFGLGSLILMAAKAAGDPASGARMVQILVALLSAMILMVWVSYVARLYRALVGSSSGI